MFDRQGRTTDYKNPSPCMMPPFLLLVSYVLSQLGWVIFRAEVGKFFSIMGQIVHSLGSVVITPTQLPCRRVKALADKMQTNGHGFIPIKLYSQKQVLDLAYGCHLLTFVLDG